MKKIERALWCAINIFLVLLIALQAQGRMSCQVQKQISEDHLYRQNENINDCYRLFRGAIPEYLQEPFGRCQVIFSEPPLNDK